ncbi:hypothetical protein ABZY09_33680 [Streptomyces sp. NPDC002928]|uniref:hypothetical protein n=1 Tax=Streptomyces sp. NPDC002928 TaxID=3154440 RepID=UPI0033A7634A
MVGRLDRRHDDERAFLITYFRAGSTVIEVFGFDVDTAQNPWQPALICSASGPSASGAVRGSSVTPM